MLGLVIVSELCCRPWMRSYGRVDSHGNATFLIATKSIQTDPSTIIFSVSR